MNLTAACRRCNRAKDTRSLLEFVAGLKREIELKNVRLARFGGIRVATADLGEATGNGKPASWSTGAVLDALRQARPEADGALAYRQRHRGRGQRPAWIHALATPTGGADAGRICQALGGGGSKTRGGVESDEPLFEPIERTSPRSGGEPAIAFVREFNGSATPWKRE